MVHIFPIILKSNFLLVDSVLMRLQGFPGKYLGEIACALQF